MQAWTEYEKSDLPFGKHLQILYQFLGVTQNLKRSQQGIESFLVL